ncbi:MAG TPA: hypothetical protein PKA82_09810 [Pyrinomonadaceae bacterium]|nr:hypothetical protein [Pyrinomonadaceae bacterium]
MRRTLLILSFLVVATAIAIGQPRPADKSANPEVKPAPPTVAAKYEGGLFGYRDKIDGTLKFDDANLRLAFFNKENKEIFQLPFDSLNVVYPSSESKTSTTGNVISNVPLPGAGLASLLKEKRRYLVIAFDDPDADIAGTISFRIDDKDLLESVIYSLGTKAKLNQRGDSYYRPRAKPAI